MKVIAFSSIKGGSGKSSLAILTANYCAAAGARVLVIDLDIQNSASFYYLDDFSPVERHNAAQALTSGRIAENIIRSNYMGIDLLPAAFALVSLRTLGERTLKRQLAAEALPYDFAFIDCAPTYDALVLNAVNASDLIVNPVRFSQFDYKGAVFYRDQIEKDTDRLPAWHILFNFYHPPRTDNAEALGNQYEGMFRNTFGDAILPFTIPDSFLVQRAVDTRTRITEATAKLKLFDAIRDLAGYIGANGAAGGF